MKQDRMSPFLKDGKSMLLAYDQGLEHGPSKDFDGRNVDPAYIMDTAAKGKFNGVIFQKGVAERFYDGRVPLIVKVNGKTSLPRGEPISRQVCCVEQAASLGAKGVGYTIYLGSQYESKMLAEFGRIQEQAHGRGIAAIARASIMVWDNIPWKSGLLSATNPSGETQKAIDVYSNDIFAESLTASGHAAEVASEEMAEPAQGKGAISVAMDPLDGSSNVESNNPLGSIFGFYSKRLPTSGRNLAGALYVTYGNVITLTFSFGKGVHRFVAVRDGPSMSFELLGVDLKLPEKPEVYGFGGQRGQWIAPVRDFVDSLEGRGMKLRYCGTFVGDYNQVLARGGIFAYPQLNRKPRGKLRILYETAPMAFLNEQAGGYASDGKKSILEIEPESLAETSPAYVGSASLVKELEARVSSA